MFLFVLSIVVNELRFLVGKVVDHLLELFEGLKVRGGHNWIEIGVIGNELLTVGVALFFHVII